MYARASSVGICSFGIPSHTHYSSQNLIRYSEEPCDDKIELVVGRMAGAKRLVASRDGCPAVSAPSVA